MEAFIQAAALRAGAILWSRHAIERLVTRRLSRKHVEASLATCSVIEVYPDVHRPLPDGLVLAWQGADEPLHAVVALDIANNRLFIVTVYRPDPARWSDDWKRRRS
ncbi:MAG TPA: DUF4258 domain-containing protein [Kofleriaceae bacterium]|nr:DUF4258 domain-containing protein [Kofleriaceae bacterium]